MTGAAPGEPTLAAPGRPRPCDRLNVVLVLLISTTGGLSLWLEGYAARIDRTFAIYSVLMCAAAGWIAARAIPRRRFLRLIVIAGAGGYLTQYVGASLGGIWSYPPPDRTFYFVPATFMIASLVVYGLVGVFTPRWRRCLPEEPHGVNRLVVLMLAVVVIACSSRYRDGQGAAFWLYYGAMFTTALYVVAFMDTPTLLALIGAAIVVGLCSESLGARSGLWTFDNDPDWLPPMWLVLGSWPLEMLMHFSLSAPGFGRVEPRAARARAGEPRWSPPRAQHDPVS